MAARLKNILFVGLLCMFTLGARSQTYQELNYFSSCYWDDNTGWHCPDGAGPRGGLIQGRDGYLYGTTTSDGQYGGGTVFRMTTEGQLTTVAPFDGTNGNYPFGSLAEASDGNFYGTTQRGGTERRGTIYRLTPKGELTPLVEFIKPVKKQ